MGALVRAVRPKTDQEPAGPVASLLWSGRPMAAAEQRTGAERTGRNASLVAFGILLSRLAGFVRQYLFAHHFGQSSVAGDAFNAAIRIPNFLQNLFGEGVLSASFIPVYARLRAEGRHEEAGRVAGAVGALVGVLTTVIVAVGVLITPGLISVIAPGFEGPKRDLTITLVRVLFPGAGLLVMSAWCLGVLNSHRRFFLSYAAPLAWNAAMIGVLLYFGGTDSDDLATKLAWGSVLGSALQFVVQLPTVFAVASDMRVGWAASSMHVKEVAKNFAPVFVTRGAVQISAYVDAILASLLPTGAVTALANAQTVYLLPVSLFGMSVSAAELPAMSSAVGTDAEVASQLQTRINTSSRRIAVFVVPAVVAFVALGDVIAGALFQSGKFTRLDSEHLWVILAASSVGLLASTLGRLYSSAYYALKDTKTPLRFSLVRLTLTTVLGYFAAVPLPGLLGIPAIYGVAGLTATAGLAGWVEYALLRRTLQLRIGKLGVPLSFVLKLWCAAMLAGGVAWGVRGLAAGLHPIPFAVCVFVPYGLTYLLATRVLGVAEVTAIFRRFGNRA